jgi:hypothetical protein
MLKHAKVIIPCNTTTLLNVKRIEQVVVISPIRHVLDFPKPNAHGIIVPQCRSGSRRSRHLKKPTIQRKG